MPNPRAIKTLNNAVNRTLKNKLQNHKKNRPIAELKGCDTRLAVKQYFLQYINRHLPELKIYAVVVDKNKLFTQKPKLNKHALYNQMTHQLLEHISFPKQGSVHLIVDRSKNSLGIKEFNNHLRTNLTLCLDLDTSLYIAHDSSEKHKGIQAADLFCYGIARKYEFGETTWYDEFKDKIITEIEFKA